MMSAFFSLSTYFKQIVLQLYKVLFKLDKFFLKYEGGIKLIPCPQEKLPSKSPAILGFKFDYLKNEKNFRSEIKKHFSLFHKCSLLDVQKKLAKRSRHNL